MYFAVRDSRKGPDWVRGSAGGPREDTPRLGFWLLR